MHYPAAQGRERIKARVRRLPLLGCDLLHFRDAVRAVAWEEFPDVELDAVTGPETVGDEVSHASRDLCGTVEM